MEVQELGVKTGKKIVLLPGNTMCWRQFEPMLPLLEQKHHVFAATVPKQQYKLVQSVQSVDKLPFMLRLYTRGDDEKLKAQLRYVAKNISLETLQNCTKEALVLYDKVDTFAPDPEAKVAVWHGAKEPNMKKALAKLRRAFPNAENHPFAGYGHGEIMSHPEVAVPEIDRFLEQ